MARLPDKVAVELFEAYPPVSAVYFQGPLAVERPCQLRLPDGLYQAAAEGGRVVLTSLHASGRQTRHSGVVLAVRALSEESLQVVYSQRVKRRYKGVILVSARSNGTLRLVNELATQDYVCAVVGSETGPDWPLEALKGQAVLTQTRLARYKPGDELGDSTEQEAYLGAAYDRPTVRAAVRSVWGDILTFDGRPILPFYHAACAGSTSSAEEYFERKPGTMPYLRGSKCGYCLGSPFKKVKRTVIPETVFYAAFGRGLPEVLTRDQAGRPLKLKLAYGETVSGYEFWIRIGRKFGWDKVPGTRYKFASDSGGGVVIESTGAGHGVGLCEWGAAGLARQGKTYAEILQYYYPGTKIAK